MRPRASGLLAVLLCAGCTAGQPYPPSGGPAMLSGAAPPGLRVAILLPLSGSNAALGQAMLRAARLALASPGSPALDVRDTRGTAEGAADAARESLSSGDSLILGPLTNLETAAVAPLAAPAGVAVLAFTSDAAQARPGVWVLGITAQQQVDRLVAAARADGRSRFAAVLPDGAFGQALGDAFARDVGEGGANGGPNGGTSGQIRRATGFSATSAALRQVSGYAARHSAEQAQRRAAESQRRAAASQPGDAEAQLRAAEAQPGAAEAAGDATRAGTDQARDPAPAPEPAAEPTTPPLDALLLGSGGATLRDLPTVLALYDLKLPSVRLLGPALWAQDAPRLGGLAGAWYVAPDPALRAHFVAAYAASVQADTQAGAQAVTPAGVLPDMGAARPADAQAAAPRPRPAAASAAPPALADIAYDAAAIARVLAAQGYGPAALQRPEGFAGTDGVFALLPGGAVRRDLAVFQIDAGGGAHIVVPAAAPAVVVPAGVVPAGASPPGA